MEELDNERLEKDLREKQYFGFSSTEFYIDFVELVENTIRKVLEETCNDMKKAGSDPDTVTKEIEQLTNLIFERVKEPLNHLKEVSREIFAVPSNLEIKSSDNEEVTIEEVERLEKIYVKKCFILERYKEKIREIESLKPLYEKVEVLLNEPIDKEELVTLEKLIEAQEKMENVIPKEIHSQFAKKKIAELFK